MAGDFQLERISVTEPEVLLRALPPGQAETLGALGEAVTRALMGAGSLGKALVEKGEEQGQQDPAAKAELKVRCPLTGYSISSSSSSSPNLQLLSSHLCAPPVCALIPLSVSPSYDQA